MHPELYQRLLWLKGALAVGWSLPGRRPEGAPSTPSFADVIVEEINRANRFCVLMDKLIRAHPELKPIIEKVAKEDPQHYQLVEGMLSVIK